MSQYGYHFIFVNPKTNVSQSVHYIFSTLEIIKKDQTICTRQGFKSEIIECKGKDCKEPNCQMTK